MAGRPYRIRNPRFATLPNFLSAVRIFLLPLSLLALERQSAWGVWPVVLAVGGALATDALDGLLARGRGSVSDLGRVLDPLADKVYIAGLFLYLVVRRGFPAWLLVLVIARDLFLIVAALALARRRRVVFAANLWGKVSMVTLSLLACAYVLEVAPAVPWLVDAAVVAIGLSLVTYVRDGVRFVRGETAAVG